MSALHMTVAVIAGGNLVTDMALRIRILSNIERQLGYLERWIVQLQASPLDPERFDAIVTRAGLYGSAVGLTFFLGLTRAAGLPFLPERTNAL